LSTKYLVKYRFHAFTETPTLIEKVMVIVQVWNQILQVKVGKICMNSANVQDTNACSIENLWGKKITNPQKSPRDTEVHIHMTSIRNINFVEIISHSVYIQDIFIIPPHPASSSPSLSPSPKLLFPSLPPPPPPSSFSL
jgi:hypothetical protein